MRYTRKEFVTLAAATGVGGLLGGALPQRRAAAAYDGLPAYITNALEHQTYEMFQGWFSWLRSAGAKGYLGEHGVPNSQKLAPSEVDKWLTLFDKVYRQLDNHALRIPAVTAHVASIYAGSNNGLQIYGPDRTDVPLGYRNFGVAYEQAPVVEAHPPVPGALRGMNTSSGTATPLGFSAASPGTYGSDYVYPDQPDFQYLRDRGHNLTRISFRWERVQPQLNNPLKSAEMARLKSCFDAAAAVGMKVIPNLHTFGGRYYFSVGDSHILGSTYVPISAYKDVWTRLAQAWNGHPAVVGYDIYNDVLHLPGDVPTWEKASQAAVDGIRSSDATTRIWVCGYQVRPGYYNGLYCFVANHPTPWISGTNVGYTTHVYYGPGNGYKMSYDETVAYWQGQGY
jgi:aryl-phospho-beta-D-glucosidase BglC (GH1 family)